MANENSVIFLCLSFFPKRFFNSRDFSKVESIFLIIKQEKTARDLSKFQLIADFQVIKIKEASKIQKDSKNNYLKGEISLPFDAWVVFSQFAGVKTLKKLGLIAPQGILYTFGSLLKFLS